MITKMGFFTTTMLFRFNEVIKSDHPATNAAMETKMTFKNKSILLDRIYPELKLNEIVKIYFEKDQLIFENTLSDNNGNSVVAKFYHQTE